MTTKQQSPARTELRHLMHELAGAFLFGMPFLYTMEIWWLSCWTGEGSLNNQGQEEITVTTLEFLPVRAQEEVVLIFRNEPSSAVVHVVSYRQP